ncbi:MAG: hypothetical protein Q8P74_00955 [bacterium]|nr:hypothetical protein [bacterium]
MIGIVLLQMPITGNIFARLLTMRERRIIKVAITRLGQKPGREDFPRLEKLLREEVTSRGVDPEGVVVRSTDMVTLDVTVFNAKRNPGKQRPGNQHLCIDIQ